MHKQKTEEVFRFLQNLPQSSYLEIYIARIRTIIISTLLQHPSAALHLRKLQILLLQ